MQTNSLSFQPTKGAHQALIYWILSLLCSLGIFLFIPIARTIQLYIKDNLGGTFFTWLVLFCIGLTFSVFCYKIYHNRSIRFSKKQYIWMIGVTLLYIFFTLYLGQGHPEEAIHLLEYSLLAYFVFRALVAQLRDWTVILNTANVFLFIGILDEAIQWIAPDRFWDVRDIIINFLSGCLFLIILVPFFFQCVNKSITPYSIKLLSLFLSLNVILSGLIFSNTPLIVAEYTEVWESLSWLRYEETMVSDENSPIRYVGLGGLWGGIFILIVTIHVGGRSWIRKLKET